ncbi:ABC transporter ATP-binding protein uup, partial [Haemophilus influenzae]
NGNTHCGFRSRSIAVLSRQLRFIFNHERRKSTR